MAVVHLPNRREGEEQRDKAIRLYTFLREVTALKEAKVRDLRTYEAVMWLRDIPSDASCLNLARLPAGTESESWVQVRRPRVQAPPKVPALIADWLRPEDVGNSALDFPPLLDRIPTTGADGEATHLLVGDDPRIAEAHSNYVENLWWPWAEADRRQKPIRDVYADLFTMYQRQQRLGESYEVVLGLGYLTWRTGLQKSEVRRHLIVAQAAITFDADHGVITVAAAGDGANLTLEQEMLDPESQPEAKELEALTAMIAGAGDSPFDGVAVPTALRSWVHSAAPDGKYEESIEPHDEVTDIPYVSLAPALILRKRTERSILAMLDGIISELRAGGPVPLGVQSLVEIRDDDFQEGDERTEGSSSESDGEIYFPLAANPDFS